MRFAKRIYAGDGQHFDIELEVDTECLLHELGEKAARNKTKKSSALSGAIKVKAKKV